MGTVMLIVLIWYGGNATLYSYEMPNETQCNALGKKLEDTFNRKHFAEDKPYLKFVCY